MSYESKACPQHRSGNGKEEKVFDASEWLAAMSSHVPDKGEQLVRYYGYYSNVSRGERKKQDQDKSIPCILEPEGSSKEYRKSWARLIQRCSSVLDSGRGRPDLPPKVKAPSVTIYLDDSESQILSPDACYVHPDYPMDFYRISKPHRATSLVTISAIYLLFSAP